MEFRFAGKNIAQRKLKAIEATSSTNLSGGLLEGVSQMRARQNLGQSKNDVASVMLFTDGQANVGLTDSSDIIRALQDPEFANKNTSTNEFSFGVMPQQQQYFSFGSGNSAPPMMGSDRGFFFIRIVEKSQLVSPRV